MLTILTLEGDQTDLDLITDQCLIDLLELFSMLGDDWIGLHTAVLEEMERRGLMLQ
jgi:hypothetical protein